MTEFGFLSSPRNPLAIGRYYAGEAAPDGATDKGGGRHGCTSWRYGGLRDDHGPCSPSLKTRINIPGNFWTGTLPADRNKLFAVEAVEVEEMHVFGSRHTGPGARLLQMADLDSDEPPPRSRACSVDSGEDLRTVRERTQGKLN